MEVLLMKNGGLKMLITSEDVIDEKFLEALDGSTCKLVTNQKIGDDVTLSFGLLIEKSSDKLIKTVPNKSIWNLFGIFNSLKSF